MLQVGFVCNVPGAKKPKKPVEKKLSQTMQVSQMRTMCKKVFGLKSVDTCRFYFKDPLGNPPFLMDSNPHCLVGAAINNLTGGGRSLLLSFDLCQCADAGTIIVEDADSDTTADNAMTVQQSHAAVRVHSEFQVA